MNLICSTCKESKLTTEYHKDKSRKTGYKIRCKACTHSDYLSNTEKHKLRWKERYEKTADSIKLYQKNYNNLNREKIRQDRNKYTRKQRELNSFQAIIARLRSRLQNIKKGKLGKAEQIIGCNSEAFLLYLESTWNQNYPGQVLDWKKVHIDHIIPLASAKSEDELIRLNHFSNLQLLLAKDNQSKGSRRYLINVGNRDII